MYYVHFWCLILHHRLRECALVLSIIMVSSVEMQIESDGAAASPFVWTVEISVFEWGNFSELRLCWWASFNLVE